jgi:ABC-type nitrate/sulfonate/bicarbonate transport system substrate-binding protein
MPAESPIRLTAKSIYSMQRSEDSTLKIVKKLYDPRKFFFFSCAALLITAMDPAWGGEKGLERVRIAVSSKSLGFFDTWAARERGFYRHQGLDAEIIAMRPPVAVAALQAGEIDYNFGASTNLRAAISGLPVKLVTLSLRSSFHTLTAKSSIKSTADLKGKVIAVTLGAADDVVCRLLVRRAGLDLRDVKFISMAGSDTRFQSLLAGTIDATGLSLPFFILARKQGFNVLGTAVDVVEMATVGIGTSTRKIQQEREQVKKMVQAQLDTLRWIKNQKAEAIQFLQRFFGLDEGVALESHELYSRLIVDDARPVPTAVKTVLEQEGKAQMPLDRVVDATIVVEVLGERR